MCFKNGHPQVEIPDVVGRFFPIPLQDRPCQTATPYPPKESFFVVVFFAAHFHLQPLSSKILFIDYSGSTEVVGILSVYPQISGAKFHIHIMQHLKKPHRIEQRRIYDATCDNGPHWSMTRVVSSIQSTIEGVQVKLDHFPCYRGADRSIKKMKILWLATFFEASCLK